MLSNDPSTFSSLWIDNYGKIISHNRYKDNLLVDSYKASLNEILNFKNYSIHDFLIQILDKHFIIKDNIDIIHPFQEVHLILIGKLFFNRILVLLGSDKNNMLYYLMNELDHVPLTGNQSHHIENDQNELFNEMMRVNNEMLNLQRELHHKNSLLSNAEKIANIGSWQWRVQDDEWMVSDNWKKIHGIQKENISTSDILDMITEKDKSDFNRYFVEHIETGSFEFEYKITSTHLPQYKYIHLCGKPIVDKNGKTTSMYGFIQDITAFKKIQQELIQTAEDLKRSNNDLKHFAYSASHDLKEPLRTISSFLYLISNKLKKENLFDQDFEEYLNFAQQGSKRMKSLIESLLLFSSFNRNRSIFTSVDLNQMVHDVIEDLNKLIEENEAVIIVKKLPFLYGNESQLRIVFQNLLMNGIKYRKDNTSPHIQIDYFEDEQYYTIFIKDNGMGIEKQYHNEIFELFRRLNSQCKITGAGIGLATVKKIIDFHDGKIWVESEPGDGSTFFFSLPKIKS